MNRRLVIVYITGLLIGVSYGLHGPLLPIFAKDVIGASYAESVSYTHLTLPTILLV